LQFFGVRSYVLTNDISDALEGFERSTYSALGRTRPVYSLGEGPVVLVLSEMPGITPSVAGFARTVAARGFHVVMPHLFGTDGAEPTNSAFAKTLLEVCVSREFTLFATDRSSPVTKWLTMLAHHEHKLHGGPGVGVVGMCLTGGFALAMMVDPVVVAPVLSQPSLPVSFSKSSPKRASVQLSADDKEKVLARVKAGTCVMAMRFSGDPLVPGERFAALREMLGDNFIGVEIDSSPTNQWGYKQKAHSVLTEDLGENPDSPTHHALEEVLSFLGERLTS
jgi:dienelactone hydrolase